MTISSTYITIVIVWSMNGSCVRVTGILSCIKEIIVNCWAYSIYPCDCLIPTSQVFTMIMFLFGIRRYRDRHVKMGIVFLFFRSLYIWLCIALFKEMSHFNNCVDCIRAKFEVRDRTKIEYGKRNIVIVLLVSTLH